ncbi:LCP family protein [Modestobacter sp. NPDC049651]|uniref:LCP family protein n=1 Tax=unclassified Modestobacter TaxID=2643866 RepID=UPI00340D7DF9
MSDHVPPRGRRARREAAAAAAADAGATRSAAGLPPVAGPPPPRTGPHPAGGLGRALGLTVAGTVVPGTAFLASGRRRTGAVVLGLFVLLVAAVVWIVTRGLHGAVRMAFDSTALVWLMVGAVVVALAWVVAVLTQWRAVRPRPLRAWQRGVAGVVVALLALAVVAPAVQVVRLASAQRDLVDSVFAEHESATVTEPEDTSVPFGGKKEVNVLLLGGDGGEGREGVRTDTVIVANVQVATGRTTLFSLPRNLENLPFPASSPLGPLYPNGFDAGSESESLLNAVYRNGPAAHPGVLGPTDDEGADWLKLGVGEALGLHLDYFALVNLDGFSKLVDALGGVTVNVNYWVPVNGITNQELPDDYITPGPAQHMDGYTALQFARGRYGLTDYLRMDRQRCVLQAMVDQADPVTLLRKYQELASTAQDIISTDMPQSVLGDVVDLAFKVKDAGIRSVVFDDTVISPAYPDYPKIRSLVQQALHPTASGPAAPPSADGGTTAPVTSTPTAGAPATGTAAGGDPAASVSDVCAYNPQQAQEQLAAGKPPTRQR